MAPPVASAQVECSDCGEMLDWWLERHDLRPRVVVRNTFVAVDWEEDGGFERQRSAPQLEKLQVVLPSLTSAIAAQAAHLTDIISRSPTGSSNDDSSPLSASKLDVGEWETASAKETASGGISDDTSGSAGAGMMCTGETSSKCRPCSQMLLSPGGCIKGQDCPYCHVHPRKVHARPCKKKREKMRARREMANGSESAAPAFARGRGEVRAAGAGPAHPCQRELNRHFGTPPEGPRSWAAAGERRQRYGQEFGGSLEGTGFPLQERHGMLMQQVEVTG